MLTEHIHIESDGQAVIGNVQTRSKDGEWIDRQQFTLEDGPGPCSQIRPLRSDRSRLCTRAANEAMGQPET